MAPFSYQPPTRGDKAGQESHSQSAESNLSHGQSTVASLLETKGDAIFAIRPNDTVGHAVEALKEKRIGALVVTDQNGALQGILSERDIVRRLADTPGHTLPQLVEEIMTREVKTCAPGDLLIDVAKVMNEGRFRHLPVLKDGKLAGMITVGDVVNFRLKELEYEALRMKQMIVG
ncbi:CBS domain-containing protein [Leisingera sp. SS27]|uniref:CBS domain-containing protein n=1 Tax=Leisingera sp. SS27 TaxID=2979462 RepID=UPI00179F5E43|nr:CBS domain-containing protein [Leisingera sp. SS27]MDC0659942.1 CBS domain-containing protein [Leisingera sp. SS27]NVK14174.1 CBS domain-containing protein [Paracoccaceae bacterium]